MSYQVGSACFATQEAALSALAARETGHVVGSGDGAAVVTVTPSGGGLQYTASPVGGGAATILQVDPGLQPCGLLELGDVGGVSAAIAGVWAAAWCIRALVRLIYSSGEGTA